VPQLVDIATGAPAARLLEVPPGTQGALATAGAALGGTMAAAVAAWAATSVVQRRRHHQRWVLPLHIALHQHVGIDDPRHYLTVPRALASGKVPSSNREGVIVDLPPDFSWSSSAKAAILDVTTGKLGLDDVSSHWERKGQWNFLQLRPVAHAPGFVAFANAEHRVFIEAAKASAPLIGLTAGRVEEGLMIPAPVAYDLDHESPHMALSAGTGGAKSSTLRAIVAQLMHHGACTVVIDLKRHSQMWLRDLPGVLYVRDPEDIHHVLIALAAEADRRNRAWDNVRVGEKGPTFPRLVVVCEELNGTIRKLRSYWKRVRTPSVDPQLSPAIEAIGDMLFMGRGVQVNLLVIAQRLDADLVVAAADAPTSHCVSWPAISPRTGRCSPVMCPSGQPRQCRDG
jgi:hypothetical protein